MLVPGDLANSEMGYIALFITGLLTSVHCVAMCGGINASCSRHGIQYNIGRVISYTVTGFILGGIGMAIGKSEFTGASTSIQGLIKLIAGSLMLYMCLSMLGLVKKIQLKKLGTAYSAFGIGLLNGLMPCGPLQTMQIVAFSTMNPLNGALSMLAFSLGTLPLMLGFSFVSNVQKIKWLSTYIVGVVALSMISQGGSLVGHTELIVLAIVCMLATLRGQSERKYAKYICSGAVGICVLAIMLIPNTSVKNNIQANEKVVAQVSEEKTQNKNEETQEIVSEITGYGYPNISVKAGIPVKWVIKADSSDLNGCNSRIVIPELGIEKQLQSGENIIEFTPDHTGTINYSCWMGMIRAKINVV